MKPVFKRSATFLAVAGLTLSLGAVGAPATFAQDAEPAPVVVDLEAMQNLVNFEATGSITVVKSGQAPGAQGTGNADSTVSPLLQGATFELYKVMDIDNAADFKTASELTIDTAGTGTPVETAKTTDEHGVAKWEGLAVGLYRVVETEAPAGYEITAPYLVYVPMTNPSDTTQWNYDITTYPKDPTKPEAKKEVVDADQNVSENILYKITSSIPAVSAEGVEPEVSVSSYRVEDQLDTENVKATGNVVVRIGNETETGFTATQTLDPADYTVTGVDTGNIVVTLEQTGLNKLTAAKRADATVKLQTEIEAEVLAVGATDGVALNTATVFYDEPQADGTTEEKSIPTNEVKSYWAKLRVNKTGENGAALAGAKFEVYQCTDAENLTEKITIGEQSEWETGETGELIIDGLHVTDIEDNDVKITKSYCLVETEAPAGYELLTDPIVVTLNSTDLTQEIGDAAKVSRVVPVENIKSNQIKLPLTGGMGIGIFAALGALIIGAGAFAARRNNA